MSDFFQSIIDWIVSLFGGASDPKAIEVTGPVCMPLFYLNAEGKMDSTWNYLSKSPEARNFCRDHVKSVTVDGEQPAIAFLLSSSGNDGGIFSTFPTLNQPNLDDAKNSIIELLDDDIAAFGCLYTDDANPRWWAIGNVVESWKIVNDNIGELLSGVFLSIETYQYTKSLNQMQECIDIMRSTMPGIRYYGTHLEWNAKSDISPYRWLGESSTPVNADIILVELWQPQSGDSRGVQGVKILYSDIVEREPNKKLIIQEYNFNPNGDTCRQQREWLRNQKPFGVG